MYQNIYVSNYSEGSPSQVYIWDDVNGLEIRNFNEFRYAYKPDPNGKFISMTGERLTKIKRFDYDDPSLFESDLSRETRVLTDMYLDDDTPSTGHRVLVIDIEAASEGGFGTPENPFQPITAIGLYHQAESKYYVLLLDPDSRIESHETETETILSFTTERELMEFFLTLYTNIQPTIITGWNVDGYDIPYLFRRSEKVLGIQEANKLSPIGHVHFNPNRLKYQIAGVSVLDYLSLYKKFTFNQQPSYRLDAIGKLEVGMGKVEYEGSLDNLYRTDLKKFIEYNMDDVKIVVKIDEKMKLIDLARFICHLGHVPYEDYSYSSKFIEGTILTYLHRKGIIATNKPAGGRDAFNQKMSDDSEGFTGAFVKEPKPGLYQWVYSLDLQSLYPSIIMSLNISPETKVGRMLMDKWNMMAHIQKQYTEYVVLYHDERKTFDRDGFMEFLRSERVHLSSNGILYSTKKVGIIPEILDKWFAQRKEFKDLMKKYVKEGNKEQADFYDRRQHVQKILLNSIYGVLGLPIFRFYDLDNAAAVTLTGQDVIKTTARYIESEYAKMCQKTEDQKEHCIYIDTDSVYFSAYDIMNYHADYTSPDPKQFTINLAREMESKVNKFYDVMAKMIFNCDKHRFYIKGESVMETGFWVAKKRYAMKKVYDLETNTDVTKDKPSVKGLDVVRSSFPPAFQHFMTDTLKAILNQKQKAEINEQVLGFYNSLPKYTYKEVARNTSIKNISKYYVPGDVPLTQFVKGTPIHAKAALIYNRLLKEWGKDKVHAPIKNGDKIKYVYLKPNQYRIEVLALKTYDDPPEAVELVEKYLDYSRLFDAEFGRKLADFYDALGWGIIPTKVNQVSSLFFTFN